MEKGVWMPIIHCTVKLLCESLTKHAVRFVECDCCSHGVSVIANVNICLQRIVDWLADDFKKTEGVDLLKDKQALQRLTETAEKAKMELSSLSQASIRFAFLIL